MDSQVRVIEELLSMDPSTYSSLHGVEDPEKLSDILESLMHA
jgi:hypothetical protein